MTKYVVEVSDSALMHLCLIGLESYCMPRIPKETYGILWGRTEAPHQEKVYYHVDHVSSDIEAERRNDHVKYNKQNLTLKADLVRAVWPSLSFLGDFHTHPYTKRRDARGGWQISEGDRLDVEETNRRFWHKQGLKVNLVMSIHPLKNRGSQTPGRIKGRDNTQHYNTVQWTLRFHAKKQYYRLRLAAYVVNQISDGRRNSLLLSPRERDWKDDWLHQREIDPPHHSVRLDVPSVLGRFNFRGD